MLRTPVDPQPVPASRERAVAMLTALLLVLLAVFLLGHGGPPTPAAGGSSAGAGSAQTVAAGRQLYATHCAGCHGANREGAPPTGAHAAPPLDAHSAARTGSDAWLFTTIRDGGQTTAPPGQTSLMPAMGSSMTDSQIRAVIAYLRQGWTAAP